MLDPLSTVPRTDATRRARRILPAFAVLATLGLGACGQMSTGGGTELPIQVRISVSSRVEAKEWRLWSVEERPVAARGVSAGFVFVSRGLLRDSAGILDLPGDPGIYLLEAWVMGATSDSLDVSVTPNADFRIDSTCIQRVPLSGEIVRVELCTSIPKGQLPSGRDSAHAPDRLSILQIEGHAPQRLQILDDPGVVRQQPLEARLWSISNDTTDDQTLLFRGRLTRETDGTFRMPVKKGNERFVIEASRSADALPTRIASHAQVSSGWTRFLRCGETILAPLPPTFSVHECPELGWKLSGTDSARSGADLWSVFTLSIP